MSPLLVTHRRNRIKAMSYARSLLVCQEKSLLFSNGVKRVYRVRFYSILGICGGLYDTVKGMEKEKTLEGNLFSSDHLIQDRDGC